MSILVPYKNRKAAMSPWKLHAAIRFYSSIPDP